jgi:hypothetical protein
MLKKQFMSKNLNHFLQKINKSPVLLRNLIVQLRVETEISALDK